MNDESLFFSISSLVEDFSKAVTECRIPALGLEELLRQRAKDLQGKEESQVMKVFHNSSNSLNLTKVLKVMS